MCPPPRDASSGVSRPRAFQSLASGVEAQRGPPGGRGEDPFAGAADRGGFLGTWTSLPPPPFLIDGPSCGTRTGAARPFHAPAARLDSCLDLRRSFQVLDLLQGDRGEDPGDHAARRGGQVQVPAFHRVGGDAVFLQCALAAMYSSSSGMSRWIRSVCHAITASTPRVLSSRR